MSVLPYQFEPEKKKHSKKGEGDDSDDSWEDVESENDIVDETRENELETNLTTLNRIQLGVKVWCKCGECKTMPVNRECLCCHEIDDIKFKKLSDGKVLFLIFIFSCKHICSCYVCSGYVFINVFFIFV